MNIALSDFRTIRTPDLLYFICLDKCIRCQLHTVKKAPKVKRPKATLSRERDPLLPTTTSCGACLRCLFVNVRESVEGRGSKIPEDVSNC